jgi:hypothetical protein
MIITLPILVSVAHAAPATGISTGLKKCCHSVGVRCESCRTYDCCMTGCEAGREAGGDVCKLLNCDDQCGAAFPL